jgi:hypothetical protein
LGKKCFVISPIGEEGSDIRRRSDQIFEYAIKPAVIDHGYSVERADLISSPGIITSQIIDRLLEDDLVIADITYKNPNVFYELAIRHFVDKPVIQIKEYSEVIPFDVTTMRTINVDYRFIDSINSCKDDIIRQIKSIEKNRDNPSFLSNPISLAKKLKHTAGNKEQQKIVNELLAENRSLKTQLAEFPIANEVKLAAKSDVLSKLAASALTNQIMDALEASEAAKLNAFSKLAASAFTNRTIKGNKSKSPTDDDPKKTT